MAGTGPQPSLWAGLSSAPQGPAGGGGGPVWLLWLMWGAAVLVDQTDDAVANAAAQGQQLGSHAAQV